jgi:hypothetical protein
MTQPLLDRADIGFLLFDWLNADALTGHGAFADHNRETFEATLDLAASLSADAFATHYKQADRQEPRLVDGRVELLPAIKTGGLFRVFRGSQYCDCRLSDADRRQRTLAGAVWRTDAD